MIFTFYSFKGGVGRSMTLANVAAWLSKWGQRVLIVDWDLEAPGIEKYFQPWLRSSTLQTDGGLVELITDFKSGKTSNWRDYVVYAQPPKAKQIDFVRAGRDDPDYVTRLRALDWEDLFDNYGFGKYLETLRREWLAEYDVVLIDSRTGVTDIGGICTIHLPDVVVAMFTANDQSLIGAKKVLRSARIGHNRLPVDRMRLLVVPVPSRDETNSEHDLAIKWRARFATEFAEFFEDWVPTDELPTTVLNYLKIPYFAYWSFGEKIPVLEQEDPDNPKTLAYAYQALAKLILGRMNWKEAREGARASEEALRQTAEAEKARLQAAQIAEEASQREAKRRAAELAALQERIDEYVLRRVDHQRDLWIYSADGDRLTIRWLTIAVLFLLVLTALFGIWSFAMTTNYQSVFRWGTFIAGGAVFFVGSLIWLYRQRARSKSEIADQLESEKAMFRAGGGPYAGIDKEKAFASLVTRIEAILEQPRKRLVQEQSEKPPISGGQNPTANVIESPLEVSRTDSEPREPKSVIREIVPRTNGYRYDAFLSFPRQPLMVEWIDKHFLPILSFWLREDLGHEPRLFIDSTSIEPGDRWPTMIARSVQTSRCLLAFLTSSYFQSPWCLSEFESFMRRAQLLKVQPPNLIIPIVLHGGENFPPEVKNFQLNDFRDFFVMGDSFRQTERYITFQQRVKELSVLLAERIVKAPPFDPDFPFVTKTEADRPPAKLPSL